MAHLSFELKFRKTKFSAINSIYSDEVIYWRIVNSSVDVHFNELLWKLKPWNYGLD